MRFLLVSTLLPCFCLAPFSFAQHGIARSGTYPDNYKMDTWTGKLLAYDPATHAIRLACDLCADKQEFTAILGDPEASKVMRFKIAPRDVYQRRVQGQARKPAPDTITLGDILRVYYITHRSKQAGGALKYNAVFEMEMVVAAAPPADQAAAEPERPEPATRR